MRRSNLEIKEESDIMDVLETCDTCRLALNAEGAPYIVPLNYGYSFENGALTLYFHCGNKGRKLELMNNDPCAGFEMDCDHLLISGDEACHYTMNFRSIIGFGMLEKITDPIEKKKGLDKIMLHLSHRDHWVFDEEILKHTSVIKLIATDFTGKAKGKEPK